MIEKNNCHPEDDFLTFQSGDSLIVIMHIALSILLTVVQK